MDFQEHLVSYQGKDLDSLDGLDAKPHTSITQYHTKIHLYPSARTGTPIYIWLVATEINCSLSSDCMLHFFNIPRIFLEVYQTSIDEVRICSAADKSDGYAKH